MNIAYFTDTYKPQINGVVRSAELFARELRKTGSVMIFSPSSVKEKSTHGFPSIEFKNYPGYRIALPYSMMYDDLFKRETFDIVHIHSPFTMGLAGLMFARKRKIPVVGTFHTLLPEYLHHLITSEKLMHITWVKNNLKKMSWSYLKKFYNKCDAVVAPTEEIKRIIERNGIKNVVVIPTGIDMKQRKYTKGVKKKYGIKGKVILHTGRITKEKSIDSILNMITPLLKNATFVIASDGPYREKLEEIVQKKGFADSVKFTGYLSEEDLIGFYKEADVFVMASKTETQGLVLLEAAFYGLPSVVMEAPVIADFVRSNKIGTVSKKKSFATIVKKYLNKRQRVSKSNIKQYDIQKCAKQMEELYQNLVQSQ